MIIIGIPMNKYEGRREWHDYWMIIAKDVSSRSTCLRRKCGCVIVDTDNRILSTGYNGPPRGDEHCQTCKRADKPHNVSNEGKHSEYTICPAVHAEENAMLNAGIERTRGSTLYIYSDIPSAPCYRCSRLIKNAGIKTVIHNTEA